MKLILIAAFILVHDWYPNSCCGGVDCHPVPCDSISETTDGYVYDGVHFTTASPSPDKQCHACIHLDVDNHYQFHRRGECLYIQLST